MSLMDAIKAGDVEKATQSLDSDPETASSCTPEGVSYIMMAMYHRQPEIARAIAARKPDLDIYEACALGDRARVAALLADNPGAGHSFSPDGFTPIALAAFFSHPEIVQLLAEAGVDVNAQARNPMKVAAIHAAVSARDARSVEILLQHGADPNLRQQNDYTPLQAAEVNKDDRIISLLKAAGAV